MFYSHTFLGRKGPLGTVWIAAHLQHRLRKQQYMSTDIRSTAERIMFPEVPIALRMSGHLLLGLVRIYSKKVDYLYLEYENLKVFICKHTSFAGEDVNLPPNANRAQFDAVTFPETYELDAVDIDDDWPSSSDNGVQDNHTASYTRITLADEDQVPTTTHVDPGFITITFDDEVIHQETAAHEEAAVHQETTTTTVPMEEDTVPVQLTEDGNAGGLGDNNNNTTEIVEDEIEVMRDADTDPGHHLSHVPEFQPNQTTTTPGESSSKGPSGGVHVDDEEELRNLDMELETALITSKERSPASGQLFTNLSGTPQPSHPHFSLADDSPNLEIRPSPSPQLQFQTLPQRPPPRRRNRNPNQNRKRKRNIDETLVFSNESMNQNLQEYGDIRRKKIKLPCVARDLWWFNSRKNMEQSFQVSSFSGMCSDLRAMHDSGFVRSHPSLHLPEEEQEQPLDHDVHLSGERTPEPVNEIPHHDANENQIPQTTTTGNVLSPVAESPEILRDAAATHETQIPRMPGSGLSPVAESPEIFRDDAATHETQIPRMPGTGLSPVPESPPHQTDARTSPVASPGTRNLGTFDTDNHTVAFEMETPSMSLDFGHTPAFFGDELTFLEADSSTPPDGSPVRQGNETMSARTRAVALYLKKCSPSPSSTESSSSTSGEINLNTVLEGRSRKLCARMIYETLALKDRGLIDVRQDKPYEDIMVKVKKEISRGQF